MINKPILRGLLSYIPYLFKIIRKGKYKIGTGGTDSAEYCYTVWLRHLISLNDAGLTSHPKVIAEIGPGDSIGIGLAALITGANTYHAFDIIKHSNPERNLKIFDELADLFSYKRDLPSDDKFPFVTPKLSSYSFPEDILPKNKLNELLSNNRLNKIRNAIKNGSAEEFSISYKVPWYNENIIKRNSVDLIFSQAVMEHIDNLSFVYEQMYKWLKPNGIISHVIDYSAHETHDEWNGHWTYSKLIWSIIMHGRSYLINREPHSKHKILINNLGFRIINEIKTLNTTSIKRNNIKKDYKELSSDDLIIQNAIIQAIKLQVK